MLFTVIVPIYEVEEYLPQCIESVLNQSYKDFELILVNDGSPDNSGNICDIYAKNDKRIKVIHKQNGGLSDARNHGLSIARGKFIWFLDSDDYMAQSAMSNVANILVTNYHLDMITCAHINLYSDANITTRSLLHSDTDKIMDRNEYIYRLHKSKGSYWAAWKNIYRSSIIKQYNLTFSKGLIGAEDCDFFMRFVRYAETFSFLSIPIVYYRINRKGSITNTMSRAAIMGQLNVFKDNHCIYNENKNEYMKVFFANKFANTISLLHFLNDKADISEVTRYIKGYRYVLKDSKGLKYYVAKAIWSAFGYYEGSKMLHRINNKI